MGMFFALFGQPIEPDFLLGEVNKGAGRGLAALLHLHVFTPTRIFGAVHAGLSTR